MLSVGGFTGTFHASEAYVLHGKGLAFDGWWRFHLTPPGILLSSSSLLKSHGIVIFLCHFSSTSELFDDVVAALVLSFRCRTRSHASVTTTATCFHLLCARPFLAVRRQLSKTLPHILMHTHAIILCRDDIFITPSLPFSDFHANIFHVYKHSDTHCHAYRVTHSGLPMRSSY